MESTPIVHPAYWRAVSDLSYALLCMTAFCSNEKMREEINSLHECITSIHQAYGILKADTVDNHGDNSNSEDKSAS